MAKYKLTGTGLTAIDSGIKELRGVIANALERVQVIAVAIISHAAGAGAGDVSRAGHLMAALPRSMDRNMLAGFFEAFGSINAAKLKQGEVKLLSRDSKNYVGFDVDGANANNWYEAFDEQGNRAPWYRGPNQPEFEPDGLGDIAGRIENFAKRLDKSLTATKEVKGREVPQVELNGEDLEQVKAAIETVRRIGSKLACRERIVEAEQAIEQDRELLNEPVVFDMAANG
jgi:hypothetical protein